MKFLPLFVLILVCTGALAEEQPVVLPGKGLQMHTGQFAEYRSLVALEGRTNEITRTRLMVLEEKAKHPGLIPVAVLSFARGQLVKRHLLFYDPHREPQAEGKLTNSETDPRQVGKQTFDCVREKRVSENGTALTWTSTSVPISGVVRNEISSGGKTLISELVLFGPEGMSEKEITAFKNAMNSLKQPIPAHK